MNTRKENYNGCKGWTNCEDDAETEHLMPQLGNLGAIQRHSLSHKVPKWLTTHETNQDLDTATEFPFIKKSQTCGSNYTIPSLTDMSKILLCILFKRIVNKQKNHHKTPLQKNLHTEQAAFTHFTQMRNCDSTCTYYGRKHRQVTGNHFTALLWTLLRNYQDNWSSSSYPVGRWNWWKSCMID